MDASHAVVRRRRPRAAPALTLIIVGQRRAGKTALARTLQLCTGGPRTPRPKTADASESAVQCLSPVAVTLGTDELPQRVSLALVDVAGYDAHAAVAPEAIGRWQLTVLGEIERRLSATLAEETRLRRNPKKPSVLLDACVFALDGRTVLANGGLVAADVAHLQALATRLPVILCIGRSDLLDVDERRAVARLISRDIKRNHVRLVSLADAADADSDALPSPQRSDLPPSPAQSDETRRSDGSPENDSLGELPLYVLFGASSATLETAAEAPLRLGREYPHGFADCLDAAHSDLPRLVADLGENLDALIDCARDAFYERWRTRKLLTLSHFLGFDTTASSASSHSETSAATVAPAPASEPLEKDEDERPLALSLRDGPLWDAENSRPESAAPRPLLHSLSRLWTRQSVVPAVASRPSLGERDPEQVTTLDPHADTLVTPQTSPLLDALPAPRELHSVPAYPRVDACSANVTDKAMQKFIASGLQVTNLPVRTFQ